MINKRVTQRGTNRTEQNKLVGQSGPGWSGSSVGVRVVPDIQRGSGKVGIKRNRVVDLHAELQRRRLQSNPLSVSVCGYRQGQRQRLGLGERRRGGIPIGVVVVLLVVFFFLRFGFGGGGAAATAVFEVAFAWRSWAGFLGTIHLLHLLVLLNWTLIGVCWGWRCYLNSKLDSY